MSYVFGSSFTRQVIVFQSSNGPYEYENGGVRHIIHADIRNLIRTCDAMLEEIRVNFITESRPAAIVKIDSVKAKTSELRDTLLGVKNVADWLCPTLDKVLASGQEDIGDRLNPVPDFDSVMLDIVGSRVAGARTVLQSLRKSLSRASWGGVARQVLSLQGSHWPLSSGATNKIVKDLDHRVALLEGWFLDEKGILPPLKTTPWAAYMDPEGSRFDEKIKVLRWAVCMTPVAEVRMGRQLMNVLFRAHLDKIKATSSIEDAEALLTWCERVTNILPAKPSPDGSCMGTQSRQWLAKAYEVRFELSHQKADIDAAIETQKLVCDSLSATSPQRFTAYYQHIFVENPSPSTLSMSTLKHNVRSVAVIGAGASGAAAAAALKAEDYYKTIRVFERRESAGGTWIYDAEPENIPLRPGSLPPDIDPPLGIPEGPFPITIPRNGQLRFETTPIYDKLTTNVPDIAMSLSDLPFAYGPFVPHWIPRQYIENYFSWHRLDDALVLGTTVEDVSLVDRKTGKWRLTLRKPDHLHRVDNWWKEDFDAVIVANGHYAVPFMPKVEGLRSFIAKFPGRVEHAKTYRTPDTYAKQRVLLIGNSASGYDVMTQLLNSQLCRVPIYVSRRSRSRWDGPDPPPGIVWKPIISSYDSTTGNIHFEDGTTLEGIDRVVYCTGYKPSYPFWNSSENGRALWDYGQDRLINNYQHTFVTDFSTLAFVGIPRVLTFRSFEYQSVAIARLWSNRTTRPLPTEDVQREWEASRAAYTRSVHQRFHQIEWDTGDTMNWFRYLFDLAGLPELEGVGRCPPVLGQKTRWMIEHVKKYPDFKKPDENNEEEWEIVHEKDSLWFI